MLNSERGFPLPGKPEMTTKGLGVIIAARAREA